MTTIPSPSDPRPVLLRAADQAVAVIDLVQPGDAGRPTPCDEFDVARLVGHLLAVLGRITYVAGGGHAFDVPSMIEGVAPQDWAADATTRRALLGEAWADDAVLDRVLHLPFGDVPGRGAALAYVQELTTHSWDLASALGRRELLDPALGAVAADAARRFVPDAHRGQIPFGAVVPVADDAGPYDRLVAWLGRDPQWTAAGPRYASRPVGRSR